MFRRLFLLLVLITIQESFFVSEKTKFDLKTLYFSMLLFHNNKTINLIF